MEGKNGRTVLLRQEDILISSTRIVLPNKVIAMQTVSSITIDKEEIKFPRGILISSILCFLLWLFRPNSDIGEVGLYLSITLMLIGAVLWLSFLSGRKEGIVINLTSGDKEYIGDHLVNGDIKSVFNAISDAIVFRG